MRSHLDQFSSPPCMQHVGTRTTKCPQRTSPTCSALLPLAPQNHMQKSLLVKPNSAYQGSTAHAIRMHRASLPRNDAAQRATAGRPSVGGTAQSAAHQLPHQLGQAPLASSCRKPWVKPDQFVPIHS